MIRKIRVKSVARPSSNGTVRIRTTVSNGSVTKTTTKTVRVR